MVLFKMSDSAPSVRYSSICNVLHLWRICLIPTYRVYQLYDRSKSCHACVCVFVCVRVCVHVYVCVHACVHSHSVCTLYFHRFEHILGNIFFSKGGICLKIREAATRCHVCYRIVVEEHQTHLFSRALPSLHWSIVYLGI